MGVPLASAVRAWRTSWPRPRTPSLAAEADARDEGLRAGMERAYEAEAAHCARFGLDFGDNADRGTFCEAACNGAHAPRPRPPPLPTAPGPFDSGPRPQGPTVADAEARVALRAHRGRAGVPRRTRHPPRPGLPPHLAAMAQRFERVTWARTATAAPSRRLHRPSSPWTSRPGRT